MGRGRLTTIDDPGHWSFQHHQVRRTSPARRQRVDSAHGEADARLGAWTTDGGGDRWMDRCGWWVWNEFSLIGDEEY